ncbi:MAG: AI-2E family transporter [Cyanobacteria bacterium J06621_11]
MASATWLFTFSVSETVDAHNSRVVGHRQIHLAMAVTKSNLRMKADKRAAGVKFGKLAGLLALVVSLYLLWSLRQVLLLLFAAVVFATVINQLVKQLRRFSLPRRFAVPLVLFAIAGMIALIFRFIIPSIVDQIPAYTFFSEQGFEQLQAWYQHYRGYVPGNALEDTTLSDLLSNLSTLSPNLAGRVMRVFTVSFDFFVNSLLVLVMTIMMLVDPDSYRRMLIRAFPKFYRQRADRILLECEEGLNGWAIGTLFNMTVITLASGLGLSLIGVPLPIVNAVLAGCFTFIPNIGPLLSVIPPALMGLSVGPFTALGVLILYFGIQQLEGTVLTPMVMKRQVSLLPALALMAQVVFAVWFGFLGLFLALPLVIVSQVWIKELLVKDILDDWSKPGRGNRRSVRLHRQALRSQAKQI